MLRKIALTIAATLVAATVPTGANAGGSGHHSPNLRPPRFMPGAPGVNDSYFPFDGNGGYDVGHYDIHITYDPATEVLHGIATITATATQGLSAFNLDLAGLAVRSITVDRATANYSRSANELTVTPKRGIPKRSTFVVVVTYDGVPEVFDDPILGIGGSIPTDDGLLIIGEPHVAASWFPVNDHPSDAASYAVDITVPQGLEGVSNGVLKGSSTKRGWTTWSWEAKEPMASYLAMVTIGEFEENAYRINGISFLDAIDPQLTIPPVSPRTGAQLLVSQIADSSYKRLTRTIAVPAGGATLSFYVARATEPTWDYFFVEARTAGGDDWTTLPDLSGNTSPDTGQSCPGWFAIHPFLTNYQSENPDGTCSPTGTSGSWNAATGEATEWTQWSVDLSAYGNTSVEVSLSYASDEVVQFAGVAIDDIVVSTGEGSTSFEADADPLDGWMAPGAPESSPVNVNDWKVGTQADLPPTAGVVAAASFARQPEIIDFLAGYFGKYPFSAAGGIVDNVQGLGFALENQTRPIYAPDFFTDSISGDSVVVHELTHQWYGDNLRLGDWRDIWLNEGFATYGEWLWSDHEGLGSPQDLFDFYTSVIEADSPFWTVEIGDPSPNLLFDIAVYYRGAMTLHALRLTIGDDAFFTLLKSWAEMQSGDTVSTPEFIALAEQLSGQQLDDFFNEWLYTPSKPLNIPAPAIAPTSARATAAPATSPAAVPATARSQMRRVPVDGSTAG